MDAFYTPKEVVQAMIGCVSTQSPRVIADFAAGDGAILTVVQSQWPESRIIATDISNGVVRTLRKHSEWDVGRVDFLNERSCQSSKILRGLRGGVSLVLLNPPFSGRGGTRVVLKASSIACSPAMAFVIQSLPYLAPDGELVAVLPVSSLHSEKDHDAWTSVRKAHRVRVDARYPRHTFRGCVAVTAIVHILRFADDQIRSAQVVPQPSLPPNFELIRGRVQMHTVSTRADRSGDRSAVIHTTNLKHGRVIITRGHAAFATGKKIIGPAVLFPRVGQPSEDKICVLRTSQTGTLSDCVMAVTCPSVGDAIRLRASMTRCFDSFQSRFDGTCAPYTTLRLMARFLAPLILKIVAKVVELRELHRFTSPLTEMPSLKGANLARSEHVTDASIEKL
jgi:predicted RNA methylase